MSLLAQAETFLIVTYHCNLHPHFSIDHISYLYPFKSINSKVTGLAMCELTRANTCSCLILQLSLHLSGERCLLCTGFSQPFLAMSSTGLVIVIKKQPHCYKFDIIYANSAKLSRSHLSTIPMDHYISWIK